jgi:hypothetical protein
MIDQEKYLDAVLKHFDVSGKGADTPLVAGFKFKAYTSQVSPEFRTKYQQLVGLLMYLMIGS